LLHRRSVDANDFICFCYVNIFVADIELEVASLARSDLSLATELRAVLSWTSMSMLQPLERLDPGRYTQAAQVIGRAFARNPVFEYLFPDPAIRLRQVTWLFRAWVGCLAPLRCSAITADGQGVALWIPPTRVPHITLLEQLRSGLWRSPFKFGLGATWRAMRVDRDIQRRQRSDLRTAHWELEVLAVDPPAQRRGLGGALLTAGLQIADAQGIPCHLLTHRPDNVRYYQRFGFQIASEGPVVRHGLNAWSLIRPPGANFLQKP
jgi:ribosomal protein S18 acetylase RimI-like enzyme